MNVPPIQRADQAGRAGRRPDERGDEPEPRRVHRAGLRRPGLAQGGGDRPVHRRGDPGTCPRRS